MQYGQNRQEAAKITKTKLLIMNQSKQDKWFETTNKSEESKTQLTIRITEWKSAGLGLPLIDQNSTPIILNATIAC